MREQKGGQNDLTVRRKEDARERSKVRLGRASPVIARSLDFTASAVRNRLQEVS